MRRSQRLDHFLNGFEFRSTGRWFLLSISVGVLVGLAAIAFQFLSQVVMHFTLVQFAQYSPAEPTNELLYFDQQSLQVIPWMIVVVMILGGLVSGWLVYSFAPEAAGAGTNSVVDSFHNRKGAISARVPLVKIFASAVTLGTGGSGGREGPIAQIGGGLGSFFATRLKLSERDRRILLAAGMAAGVGAIFRAPLAAAVFVAEIFYKDGDLESDVIVPAAIASIVSYSVYCLSLPSHLWFSPLFGSSIERTIVSPLELIPLGGLAIVLVLVGILYIEVSARTARTFERMPVPLMLRPAIGMGLAGVFGVGMYYLLSENLNVLAILSVGYQSLQDSFDPENPLGIQMLIAIALAKIITTALTVGSGGAGGVFAPSMVIGGCLGAAYGQIMQLLMPGSVSPPQIYAVVGMAGFFAGCGHVPISTIIMVSEMTGNYSLLLPTMWVSTLCTLLCRRWTLYPSQVPTRLQSPAHRGDFIVDILDGIPVADVFNPHRKLVYVPEAMSLDDIVHMLARTHQDYYPVVDKEDRLVGVFSTNDVREWLYDETIWKLAVARDVMISNIVSVSPGDDLNTAMQRFTALNLEELPVLDPEDPGKLLGMLTRKETIAFYNQKLREYKQAR